jgi:hypothetical protein
MAAELLVDSRIEDGDRIVDQLIRDNFEVTVAFWVKSAEYAPWRLYIASPRVEAERSGQAYPALYASLSTIPNSSVQLSEIRLVNDADPIAQDVIDLRLQYPGMMPTNVLSAHLRRIIFDNCIHDSYRLFAGCPLPD